MLQLIKKYPALLFFGLVTAFFSSVGQTFLVSLFIPGMRQAFEMSQTEIAGYYAAATFLSALLLPWTGRLLDRLHLTRFSVVAAGLLGVGCLILASSHHLVVFFIGMLLVRNLGQGTMTLISTTTMARIFGHLRGKALGIANLGYPLAEAVVPICLSVWIASYGWRSGWVLLGMLSLVVLIPAIIFLLRADTHKRIQDSIRIDGEKRVEAGQAVRAVRDWTMKQVLRDPRFYLLMAVSLMAPFAFTALFFHQGGLAEWKGWSLQTMAAGFIAFGISRGTVSFLIGPVVDRISARRIFPFNLIPLGIALICLWIGLHPAWSFIYLGFAGMTMGLSMTVTGSIYAEFYGIRELGSIRGIKGAAIVFATAVAPPVMGILLDVGVEPGTILGGMLVMVLTMILLAVCACSKRLERYAEEIVFPSTTP